MSETITPEFSSAASTSPDSSGGRPNGEQWLSGHLRHRPSPASK
jgi:hypothetical protein